MYLECTAKQTAPVLQALFTQALETGTLPKDWHSTNITPIYKKGDRHLASNYQPVPLTTVSCKVLEHIIVRHILNHVEQYNILTDTQHGFRSGRSCESQLIITMHDLYQPLMRGAVSILPFWISQRHSTWSPISA